MCISLMTDVPDYLVLRGVENSVHSHSKLHNSQVGSKVSAVFRDCIYKNLSDLAGSSFTLLVIKGLEIIRQSHLFKIGNKNIRHR